MFRRNPSEAMSTFLDACGVTDDDIRTAFMRYAGRPQHGFFVYFVAQLVAHIVAKSHPLPGHCYHAFLLQSLIINRKIKAPKNVPVEMVNINAASLFLRVFAYVKALNIVCCCPITSIKRVTFLDGKLFHYLSVLLSKGDLHPIMAIDGRSFNLSLDFVRYHLDCSKEPERFPEEVEECGEGTDDTEVTKTSEEYDEEEEEDFKDVYEVPENDDDDDDDDDDSTVIPEEETRKDADNDDVRRLIERAMKDPSTRAGKSRIFRIIQQDSSSISVPVTYTNGMIADPVL